MGERHRRLLGNPVLVGVLAARRRWPRSAAHSGLFSLAVTVDYATITGGDLADYGVAGMLSLMFGGATLLGPPATSLAVN